MPPAFPKPSDKALERRFLHHPPFGDQATRYAAIRAKILETAKVVRDLTPVVPEQTRALNALDEAMFLANAAIARGEVEHEDAPGPAELAGASGTPPQDAARA